MTAGYEGFFGLPGIRDEIYGQTFDEDTPDSLREMQASYGYNMLQSAFDAQVAKSMGEYQNYLGQSNMTHAANLEQRNNASQMEQQFNYGMHQMGAQFELQNQFANATYDRDIGMLAATGQQQMNLQDNQAYNQRLQTVTEGFEQRENTKLLNQSADYRAQVAADASKYGAKASADASMYGSQQAADASKYGADASLAGTTVSSQYGYKGQTESAALAAGASKYGAKVGADASVEGAKYGYKGQLAGS